MHGGEVKEKIIALFQTRVLLSDLIAMAASIARNLGDRSMVVLAGNGHIVHKFGIPERAFNLTGASYRTVYLAPAGETVDLSYGDYIWVTPPVGNHRMP